QDHALGGGTIVVALWAEGDRQNLLDGSPRIASLAKGEGATDHGKGTTLLDIFAHIFQIVPGKVELIAKILKNDQVKIFQFLGKQALGREGDQTQLAFWDIDHISRRAQDDKRDQINTRVLLQTLPQKAIIPGRAATDQEHADLITRHRNGKIHVIVLGERLTAVRCDTDRVGKLAHLLRLNFKLHLLLEDVGRDRHRLGGHHAPSPLQHHRDILTAIAPRLYGDVHLGR